MMNTNGVNDLNDKDYVVIQGWMVNQLGLKGNELLIYALVYGYGRNGSYFTGSNQYIAECFSLSKRTVISVLNDLVDKNLLSRTSIDLGGFSINRYVANFTPGEKISLGGEEISPNNNIYNIKEYNIESNNKLLSSNIIKEKKFVKPSLEQIIEYINNKNYHFNAEDFYNHYETTGWYYGKTKMKSWESACNTWERNYLSKHPECSKTKKGFGNNV